jgi:hypothetical protein
MSSPDEWGKDPSVRYMRVLFQGMETAQKGFLERLDIPDYDMRLRKWRETALGLFEKARVVAAGWGVILNEKRAAALYIHCLASVIRLDGEDIPEAFMPEKNGLDRILREVLP